MSKSEDAKSEDEIKQIIKLEVDAERAKIEQRFAAEVMQMNNGIEGRVAAAVREHLRTAASGFSQTAITQPTRVASKEPPRYAGVEIGETGSSWISVMDAHLQLLKSLDSSLSESLLVAIAISYLDGSAHAFALQVREESDGVVSWTSLKKELRARFGVNMSPFHLLQNLRQVKQGRTSVAIYTNAFETKLGQLIAAGSTDSLSAVTYYLEGLERDIQRLVTSSFFIASENPMEAYSALKPRAAVREVAKLAQRCEEMKEFLNPQSNNPSVRVAAASNPEASVAVAYAKHLPSPVQNQQHQSWRQSERRFTRSEIVAHLSRKLNVPVAVVSERLTANVCAACASPKHKANDSECPGPSIPSPATSKAKAH